MEYLFKVTMTPFVGQSLAANPGQLTEALEDLSKHVKEGWVEAASRQADLVVEASSHNDLARMAIPWCIVTGEHPPIEPVIRGVHLSRIGGFEAFAEIGLAKEAPKASPRFALSVPGHPPGVALGAESPHLAGLESLRGQVISSIYEINSGTLRLIVEPDEPGVLRIAAAVGRFQSGLPRGNVLQPVIDWSSFLGTLRQIGRLMRSPTEPPEGCADSPTCCCTIRPFAIPKGGTDRLHFTTWDLLEIPGVGEREIELSGEYEILRHHPSSSNWVDAAIDIEMKHLALRGTDDLLGEVRAFLLPSLAARSGGQVTQGTLQANRPDGAKHCEMGANVGFSVGRLAMTVVPKEPVRLIHSITHIPPVGQGGGTGDVRLPLYNADDLGGQPVAYLRRVRTHIGEFVAPVHRPSCGHHSARGHDHH